MKKLHIISTLLLAVVLTGCGAKPVNTAAEVVEKYKQSDSYENCHMDGSMTVSVMSSSEEEMSLGMPVEVGVSQNICNGVSKDSQMYVYEGEGCIDCDSSEFDYASLMNITDDMFKDADMTVLNTDDDVVYSVVIPIEKVLRGEDLADIFAGTNVIDAVTADEFEKLISSDASVVYTFDKNCNLTDISCDNIRIDSVTVEDYGNTAGSKSVTMEFLYTFSDFGAIVSDEAIPEVIDAAPSDTNPPEKEIFLE